MPTPTASDILSVSSSGIVESVTISQSPDDLTPTITGVFLINRTDIHSDPPSLSVTVAGNTFNGVPHRSAISVTADGKTHKTTTYLNSAFKTLIKGYGIDILFISCPKYVYDAMKYDEDYILVKWKESDQYTCGGWTVTDIIEEVFTLVGLTINISIPTFDVSSPTVQYQAGSDFSQFLQGLLPTGGGLRFLWFIDANNTFNLTLVSTAATPTVDTFLAAESLEFGIEHIDNEYNGYTGWRFNGGTAKPVLGEYKYIKLVPIAEKTERETTITTDATTTIDKTSADGTNTNITMASVHPVQDAIPMTSIKETTRLYDFKDDEFHVLLQTIENRSAIYNHSGLLPYEGKTSYEEIHYTYDNADPLLYEKSRSLGNAKTTSGYITKFSSAGTASTTATSSKGPAFLLMDDLTVITKKEYDDSFPDYGTILFGSYMSWSDAFKTEKESIIYTSERDSSRNYPEGTIKNNSSITTTTCYRFNITGFGVTRVSRYFACTDNGKSVLQELASTMKEVQTYIETTWPAADSAVILSFKDSTEQTLTIYEKDIVSLTAKGTYNWKETTKELDLTTGAYNTTSHQVSIPGGRVPMEPTTYRTQQLLRDEGDMGLPTLVVPFSAQVSTNNREQFNTYVDMIKLKAVRPVSALTINGLSVPYLSGETYAGGIVTGWSISATGDGKRSISATVEL